MPQEVVKPASRAVWTPVEIVPRRHLRKWSLAWLSPLVLTGLAAVPEIAAQNGDLSPADRGAATSRFLSGQEAMQAGRFPDAETEYREVLRIDPGLTEARANLGLVLFLQGEYGDSVSELERVARERPEISTAHLFLGLGHLKLGNPDEAIPSLTRALADNPGNLEARRALAACHLAKADYASAVGQFQAAFQLAADATEGWFTLGRDYMNLMSELAGSLVVGQPESAWASRLGADMLGLSQAWEAAIPYYETAIEKRPDLTGLRDSLARAHLMLGNLDEAERQFHAELELDPYAERAWLGMAEASLARGDASAALANVRKVWELSPAWLAGVQALPTRPIPADVALGLIRSLPPAGGGPSHYLQAVLFAHAGDAGRAQAQRSLLAGVIDEAPRREAGPGTDPGELCRDHLYAECAAAMESRPSLARRGPSPAWPRVPRARPFRTGADRIHTRHARRGRTGA